MHPYQGVTTAVVGAGGFIGSWVARQLEEQGARVCRIGRETELASFYCAVRPAITFNLAGYGVDPRQQDETSAYRINSEFPRQLAGVIAACRNPDWRGQHLVHTGSGAEYGDAGGDLREDGPARPLSLYGKSKWRGTLAVAESCRELGLRGVTARLFTVYGPGERPGRLLPSLLAARQSRQPLSLSPGLQQRDFTYVEDVAEGFLRLGVVSSAEPGEAVNLATGRLTRVREFVEIAAGILGIPPENLHFGELAANAHEMEHQGVALERLRSLTGWIPPTSVGNGVRRTLETGLL